MSRVWCALTLAATMLAPGLSVATAPMTSDPNGRLIIDFDEPGLFPTTVTATNIGARPEAGALLDGSGEDFLEITFPSGGPIEWTSSRYNSGDTAISIGVANPTNPLSFPPTGQSPFVDNFQAMNTNSNPIDPNSTDLTTLSWRANIQTGALLATPRRNGVDDGYQIDIGQPLGDLFGVAYFVDGFSQGWGFNMVDGEFKNGGNGSSDLVMGHGGAGGGAHEAAFDVSAVYLPYEQGWLGAYVNPQSDDPPSFASAAPGLTPSVVTWNAGQADVRLPGVDSATDGMLFVAPTNSSSTTRIASAFPNGSGGWTTTVRLDDDADATGETILQSGNGFQFLYVPYFAENLQGGLVNGDDGSFMTGAGQDLVSLTRTEAGEYALSVFDADGTTKLNGDDGMLMLSIADTLAGSETLGSRAFMSYEFDADSGDFVIQARELAAAGGGSDDGFGNDFDLVDTDFYFAWVDFDNPLFLYEGDYNRDGVVNAADYTVWRDGLPQADGNGDSVVDDLDYDLWAANYGLGAATIRSTVSVPEPQALALLLSGFLVSLRRR